MTPRTRLKWVGILLILSFGYGVLISISPALARTVAMGYIGIMLTVLVLVEVWKAPQDG